MPKPTGKVRKLNTLGSVLSCCSSVSCSLLCSTSEPSCERECTEIGCHCTCHHTRDSGLSCSVNRCTSSWCQNLRRWEKGLPRVFRIYNCRHYTKLSSMAQGLDIKGWSGVTVLLCCTWYKVMLTNS